MVTLNPRPGHARTGRALLLGMAASLCLAGAPALAVKPAPPAASAPASDPAGGVRERDRPATPVDLNNASDASLRGLAGISAQRARAIVNGRPYAAAEELVNRKILPNAVFSNIRDRLVVGPARPGPPGPAASSKPS